MTARARQAATKAELAALENLLDVADVPVRPPSPGFLQPPGPPVSAADARAEAVLADCLVDLEQEPAGPGTLSLLRRAGKLQHESDPETAAVAREVIETAGSWDLPRVVLTSQR